MSHRPVDIYSYMPEHIAVHMPLSIAIVRDYLDVGRLIVDEIESFAAVPEAKRQRVLRHAYRFTRRRRGKLEVWLSLVRVYPGMTAELAFLEGAAVEGGSALVEEVVGKVDIDMVPHMPGEECGFGTAREAVGETVGEKALFIATNCLLFKNVDFLLRRGCRLQDEERVVLCSAAERQASQEPGLREKVEQLLCEYGLNVQLIEENGRND